MVLIKRIIQALALGTTLSMASLMASGAEVSSAALTLDPAYDVAGARSSPVMDTAALTDSCLFLRLTATTASRITATTPARFGLLLPRLLIPLPGSWIRHWHQTHQGWAR